MFPAQKGHRSIGALGRTLPLLAFKPAYDARGVAAHERVGCDVFRNYGACTNYCTFADGDAPQYDGLRADPRTVLYDHRSYPDVRPVLVSTGQNVGDIISPQCPRGRMGIMIHD